MTLKDEEAPSKTIVNKKPSIRQEITRFCSYTTAHGLGRLAESRGLFARAAWSVFCIGALTMFVVQIYNLFLIYLSRPVATVVNVHHESHVRFPAVTICNLNMIRYDKLPENFIDNLMAEMFQEAYGNSNEEDISTEPSIPSNTTDASETNSATQVAEDPTPSDAPSTNDDNTTPTNGPSIGGTTVAATSGSTSSKEDGTATPTGSRANSSTDVVTDDPPGDGGTATSRDSPTDGTIPYPYNDDYNSNYDSNDNYEYNYNYDNDYNYDYNSNYDYDYDYFFGGLEEETKEQEFETEETIRAELALQNDSTIVEMGHQFEDLVFECSFRGYDCRNYSKYWHHLWDYRHGNCYTFNGGVNDDGEAQKVLHSHITGPTGGLKLNLFIEQSQYIPELSHTAGAKVVIHDQGQIPFPNNEGYSVLPSRSTSFSTRRTVIERVDPFGNRSCVSEKDLNHNSLYSKKFNNSYSRQACLNTCHAEKQVENCGCAEGQFPSEADICNLRNTTTAKCLERIQLKLLTGDLDCETHCPTPCREIQFKTTVSMGHWPSDGYENILTSRVKENGALLKELQQGYFLSENFLQVRVYYEQLNYEKVTERISYGGVNLVADIGGQLGLWIGISVLTCCEFLELAWMIIKTTVDRFSRRNAIHIKPQIP